MITQLVMSAIVALLSPLNDLIPTVHLPSWLTSGTPLSSTVAGEIGSLLYPVRDFLPIDTVLTVIAQS